MKSWQQEQGESRTRATVRKLHAKGVPVREIASRLDISTQAVYKHLKKLREMERAS